MNFNWGHGIALFYIIFVLTLIIVLFKSFSVNHNLVVDNYYEKDLAYQEHYERMSNHLNDETAELTYIRESQEIRVTIKGKSIQGDILFYRPSDKSLDFTVPVNLGLTKIDVSSLKRGRWKVKINWTDGNNPYYMEEEIVL